VCVIGGKIQEELFPGVNPLGEILRIGDERYRMIGVTAPRGVSVGMDMDEMVMIPVSRHLQMFDRTGLFRVFVEVGAHTDIDSARAAIRDLIAAGTARRTSRS
jgi:putative ABC transport system permease protein